MQQETERTWYLKDEPLTDLGEEDRFSHRAKELGRKLDRDMRKIRKEEGVDSEENLEEETET